jgi:hypothetical protein
MLKAEILERLRLGSSVAENDDNLESYFVPTVSLEDFLADRYDPICRGHPARAREFLRLRAEALQSERLVPDCPVCGRHETCAKTARVEFAAAGSTYRESADHGEHFNNGCASDRR